MMKIHIVKTVPNTRFLKGQNYYVRPNPNRYVVTPKKARSLVDQGVAIHVRPKR